MSQMSKRNVSGRVWQRAGKTQLLTRGGLLLSSWGWELGGRWDHLREGQVHPQAFYALSVWGVVEGELTDWSPARAGRLSWRCACQFGNPPAPSPRPMSTRLWRTSFSWIKGPAKPDTPAAAGDVGDCGLRVSLPACHLWSRLSPMRGNSPHGFQASLHPPSSLVEATWDRGSLACHLLSCYLSYPIIWVFRMSHQDNQKSVRSSTRAWDTCSTLWPLIFNSQSRFISGLPEWLRW